MKRRRFLTGLTAIPLLSAVLRWLPIVTRAASADSTIRRVRPSDSSWPAAAGWEELKRQVGGRLVPVSSPLAPCREAPGSTACAARLEEMKNPYGLIQGGGFGSFSKNDGLAAASLRQAEIVTADGKVLIANAATNPDPFWALKGGGGGSFGVVTKVTLATYDLPAFFGRVGGLIKANSDAAFRDLIGAFMRFYREKLFNPHWGESVVFGADNTLQLGMVFQELDQAQAEATWTPFLDFVGASPRDFVVLRPPRITAIPARHYWDPEYRKRVLPQSVTVDSQPGASPDNVWWSSNQVEVNIFIYGYESVWLPAALLEQADRLADTLFASTRHFEVQLHFNKRLAGAPEDTVRAARDTSTNPAVLDAFALAIIAGGDPQTVPGLFGHEPDLVAGRNAAIAIAAAADGLREIVPAPGSYVSEGNYFDQSWQRSFWGPNYPRLRAVKAKYDPAGLFFVHHGVGSEDRSADGFTRST